jgi:hypothetical protein
MGVWRVANNAESVRGNALFESFLNLREIGSRLAPGSRGVLTVRNFGAVFLLVSVLLVSNSFGAPHVVRASAVPEPGILVALGGGLVGLATVRRRLGR